MVLSALFEFTDADKEPIAIGTYFHYSKEKLVFGLFFFFNNALFYQNYFKSMLSYISCSFMLTVLFSPLQKACWRLQCLGVFSTEVFPVFPSFHSYPAILSKENSDDRIALSPTLCGMSPIPQWLQPFISFLQRFGLPFVLLPTHRDRALTVFAAPVCACDNLCSSVKTLVYSIISDSGFEPDGIIYVSRKICANKYL